MNLFKKKTSGFSLIELMIVISIIGVLAALGMPKFKSFQATARQAEVKTNLNHIYVLQESYYTDSNVYSTIPLMGNGVGAAGSTTACNATNNIGFALTDCTKVRYQYSTTGTIDAAVFTGQGSSLTSTNNKVFPGCTVADVWTITENKVMSNTTAGKTACL